MGNRIKGLATRGQGTIVRLIRHGQITLPAEARRKLELQDGDYLEARVADGELWHRPVDVIARSAANRLPGEAKENRQVPTRVEGPCHLTCRLYEMTPYRGPLSRKQALTKPRLPHTRAQATRPRPLHFLALPLPAPGQAALLPGAWACDRGTAAAPSPKSRGLGRLRATALARARVWGTGARVPDGLPLLAPWAPGTGSSKPSRAGRTAALRERELWVVANGIKNRETQAGAAAGYQRRLG